jgi:hypothetical protein
MSRTPGDRDNRLQLTLVMQPLDSQRPGSPGQWREVCDMLYRDIRGYLMAK